jgi:hypothetical protein
VQDDEVAHALHLQPRHLVELVHHRRVEVAVREQLLDLLDAGLDQGDAGALQRLQEAGGQAQGDAVLVPGLQAAARMEADLARLVQQRIGERALQLGRASSSLMWREE